MASVLISGVLISGVQSKLESLSGTLCCVVGKDGLFSQSLSLCVGAQKWVPANLMLWVTLQWTH